jgi:hypothetical protein
MSYPSGMMCFALALWVALSAYPAAAASPSDLTADEALVSEAMATQTRRTLDGILGPGRSQVVISVHGERVETRSETETMTPTPDRAAKPATPEPSNRIVDLPGYTKDHNLFKNDEKAREAKEPARADGQKPYQKTHEQTYHEQGFEIKRIEASIVLDSDLNAAAVANVKDLLPKILRVDAARGDTLSVLSAPMRPAWKSAFANPADLRLAALVAGGVLAALLCALIAGSAFVRAAGVFASELGARRGSTGNEAMSAPLPELIPGAPVELLESTGSGPPGTAAALALGRRFDFLAESDPELTLKVLSAEKPEELSLLFGHMAESMPEVASRLFSALPTEVQTDTSQHMLKLTVAEPERLGALEDRLRHSIENGLQGTDRLARILSRVSGGTRETLIGQLASRDARGAQEIERKVFSFDDLTNLPAADFRRLLSAMPYEIWGVALRGASKDVSERLVAELPPGPREFVLEASASPQPLEKVVAARSKILDALAALEVKGEIKLGARGGGGMV